MSQRSNTIRRAVGAASNRVHIAADQSLWKYIHVVAILRNKQMTKKKKT